MKKIIFVLLLMPVMVLAQEKNDGNYISMTGTAELEVVPDRIVLRMSMGETERTGKESDFTKMEQNVLAFLKQIGIKKESFTIEGMWAGSGFMFSRSSRYMLNKSYLLELEKPELLDTIMRRCFGFGIESIMILAREHTKIDSLKNEVLVMALAAARSKALLAASTLGVTLGKVIMVSEDYASDLNPGGNPNQVFNPMFFSIHSEESKFRDEGNSTPGLNKISLSKTVVVRWEIE
jgi:uncharacterized protein YggE